KEGLDIARPLTDGDTIGIGDSVLNVIHIPGHSPGGIALYCPQQKFVIVGDSLFKGSIGRTDLEGGNQEVLVRAIRKGLLTLPDDTVVLSGHGESTTIGQERMSNPFL
ncbi:MAG: MBL fold metallo-hydrolase, partial [Muribaculaceae bacterium]|nr:MBL fold metallo-hydrolase [Muribaculaceae bacterium]